MKVAGVSDLRISELEAELEDARRQSDEAALRLGAAREELAASEREAERLADAVAAGGARSAKPLSEATLLAETQRAVVVAWERRHANAAAAAATIGRRLDLARAAEADAAAEIARVALLTAAGDMDVAIGELVELRRVFREAIEIFAARARDAGWIDQGWWTPSFTVRAISRRAEDALVHGAGLMSEAMMAPSFTAEIGRQLQSWRLPARQAA